MILLTIGSDRNLFKKNSDVWNRYLDYGKLFGEIHAIVFSAKKLGNKKIQIGDNVFIYPTNHTFKFLYLCNICCVAEQIIKRIVIPAKAGIQKTWIPGQARNDRVVISSQDPFEAGFAGWMLKKKYKVPLQIQIHTDFLSPHFRCESLMNKIRVLLAKFTIRRADGIRVVSERIKKSLIQLSTFNIQHFNIDVLPIFVDTEAIKSAPVKENLREKYPQFDFIILMASRLTKEKNIGLALEALAELVKKYPKLGLVVCGRGPELEKLKVKSAKLKVEKNVVFEGWSGDLVSYYKTADLYLLTSNYEGYGRSVIEALAAGIPVAMSDVGLAGEVVKNGTSGAVFEVGDKRAIISQIELLLSDKKVGREFAARGKEAVDKLMTKAEYLKLYKEIIESIKYEQKF